MMLSRAIMPDESVLPSTQKSETKTVTTKRVVKDEVVKKPVRSANRNARTAGAPKPEENPQIVIPQLEELDLNDILQNKLGPQVNPAEPAKVVVKMQPIPDPLLNPVLQGAAGNII